MSIADKLVTIAENTLKVYNAGKLNLLKDSKYMNGKEVGDIVAVNDISSIEHPVSVKVSGDTITNFSGVTVTRKGKNQVDYTRFTNYIPNCDDFKVVEEDSITVKGNDSASTTPDAYSKGVIKLYFPESPVANIGQSITLTCYVTLLEQGAYTNQTTMYLLTGSEKDTTNVGQPFIADLTMNERTKIVITRSPGVDITGVSFRVCNNKIKLELDTFQIEYGDTATEYEAYKEPVTYAANADGTVEGVTSLHPAMLLATDREDVTIECQYLRDIDSYIDGLVTNIAMTGGE